MIDMSKKVVITGANGYLGSHVTKRLLDMGNEVTAIDLSFENVDDRAKSLDLDIFKTDDSVYEKCGCPDILIHLAWRDGFFHGSKRHMTDLSGHYGFIRNMVEQGLKHVVCMGSMHEVGYHEGPIDENTKTDPLSLYGIAKDSLRRSLFLLQNEFEGLIIQWLRGFYILGDDLKNHSIFTKLIEAANENKKTFPFNSGKNKYDFIDIDDLARDISYSAMQTEINGIINCCSGTPVSLAEKVEEFIKEKDLDIKLEYGVFPDRPYDSPAIWGDDTKIKQIRAMFE